MSEQNTRLDKQTKEELVQYIYRLEDKNSILQGCNNELQRCNDKLKHENDILRERLEIVTQANKSIKEEAVALRKLLTKLADKL